jgi:hypothetical protein
MEEFDLTPVTELKEKILTMFFPIHLVLEEIVQP